MPQDVQWFQKRLFRWFGKNRRDLPWRKTRDPYKILVSEIMLQQTQVDRVVPKYRAFLKTFPTVEALARARVSAVIRAWSGLGYNRRALYVKRAAEEIVASKVRPFGRQNRPPREDPPLAETLTAGTVGLFFERSPAKAWRSREVPKIVYELEKLLGVGKYTARAIAAFAFGQDVGAVDTNVSRVLARIFFGVKPTKRQASAKNLSALANAIVPAGKGWSWNHALMDFGALVCTKKKPKCVTCPMRLRCKAYPKILEIRNPKFAIRNRPITPFVGSPRYWRGRIIELLRHATGHSLPFSQALHVLGSGMTPAMLAPLLAGLVKDRLLILRKSRISLPR